MEPWLLGYCAALELCAQCVDNSCDDMTPVTTYDVMYVVALRREYLVYFVLAC